ncbi:MAG: MazG nucleotide pyrophosphohydrolase domain-containing protein [Leptotrichiaceae bacterium]|nr:MazG nucleotide pyrophosphohydrolase domain-containing protein [Leptotrichiaceae bacterium]
MSDKEKIGNMTIKEFQFLIEHIERGSLQEEEKIGENSDGKKENGQRLVLKLIEEFGELAENIRKNIRYTGKDIKGTIEEELFDIFYYIAAIANDYSIDLEEIFYIKDKLNKVKYDREFTIEEGREMYQKLKKEGKVK